MLTRWDPFREMMRLRSEMNRMFDDSFSGSGEWQPATWGLPLDVTEDADEFVVQASLPGVKPEDIDVTYNANTLTIKGEVKGEEEKQGKQYHLRERRVGSFTRSIQLPTPVSADQIRAEFDSGVLTLHLPKAEEAKPKRIQIQGNGQRMIEGQVREGNGRK